MSEEIQRCYLCDEPTGRTAKDAFKLQCEKGPDIIVCEACFDEAKDSED